jgi:hypothetical protein
MAAVDRGGRSGCRHARCRRRDPPMTTSTLILPVSGEQDQASWAAIAFVASYSSSGTRQAYHPAAPVVGLVRTAPSGATGGRPPPARGAVRTRSRGARSRVGNDRAQAGRSHRVLPLLRFRNSSSTLPGRPASAARRSPRSRPGSDSTGPSSAPSSSRPACPAATTTPWPAYSHSTPCACPRRAAPTSATWRSPTDTAWSASWARATSPPSSRWPHAQLERSTLRFVSAPTGRCSLGRTAAASTGTPLVESSAVWRNGPGSRSPSHPTPSARR